MKIGEICIRDVAHVGALVVVDGEPPRPVGILTDRDLVVAVIAVPGARPEGIRVQDAMSTRLASVYEDEGLFEAAGVMRSRAVRRLVVLSRDGSLAGIVTLDDVLQVIATEVAGLAEALRWSRKRELAERPRLELP